MKLKEIKQGMAIHCTTQDEYKRLDEEVKNLGFGSLPIRFNENQFDSNYIYVITDFDVVWTDRMSREHIEFSDLIIPDTELSAEEALLAYDQMCNEYYCCNDCPIYGILGYECARKMEGHISEIIDAIKKWKYDHEKKEPEIETVDICRIIEIQPNGVKRCVHEEDIKPDPELPFGSEQIAVEEILKRYCMEHDGKFIAVHEVVSRVKAVK